MFGMIYIDIIYHILFPAKIEVSLSTSYTNNHNHPIIQSFNVGPNQVLYLGR